MIVALYTSRKILEALGVDDFGIFNVVGGIISLMSFINGSMSVATQDLTRLLLVKWLVFK